MSPIANAHQRRSAAASTSQSAGLSILAACLLACLAPSGARADGETVPAAWQGVWDTTTIQRACGDPTILGQVTQSDTLCAGEPVLSDAGTNCSGTVTDTSIDYTCTGTEEIFAGCTATYTLHLVATRNGDSSQATLTIETTYSAGCEGLFPDSCLEFTSTATRTAGDPHCGQLAAEPTTWSSIKARFR